MVKKTYIVFLSAAMLAVTAMLALSGETQQKYFPKDYRKWTHTKSMVIEEGHPLFEAFGGIHHVYANEKAIEEIKKGKGRAFKEGAVLIFDLLHAVKENSTIVEGERKVLAYMRKVKGNKETGGWEFGAFAGGDPQKQVVTDPVGQCFSCHEQVKDKDYVFSEWRQ